MSDDCIKNVPGGHKHTEEITMGDEKFPSFCSMVITLSINELILYYIIYLVVMMVKMS